MSITVNATLFQNQMNDSDITATLAEINMDQAINLLNVFGAGISNLSGTAGSKSGSYTSAEVGAIMVMAREVYAKLYKNADGSNVQVSGIGVTYSNDGQLLNFAKQLANQLKGRSFSRVRG